jgi:HK97 family phage major capsid protein
MGDSNGSALASGAPPTLLGRPVLVSEYAPNTFTTGKYVAVVGDFKTGYWIADTLDLSITRLNELLALSLRTGFLCTKETDGAPVVAEAFRRLKLA